MLIRVNHIRLLLGLLIVALAVACKPKQVVTNQTQVKDSIVERVVEKLVNVPFAIPGDTVTITQQIPCPDAVFSSAVSGQRANIKVDVKNGVITATAICNELRDSLKVAQLQVQNLRQRIANQSTVKEVPYKVKEPYIPRWVWWLLGINIALVLYGLYRLYIKFKNHFNALPF